ncbi:MAG TPA: hypothetical protein PLU73_10725, partial [Bacteroidia bacterium]|nr:hypothetical protein [Bacteroidia bacterium]
MKRYFFVLLFTCISFVSLCQDKKEYDAVLAKKLGSDDYGMRKYVIAFLKAGPNRNQDSATAVKLQAAHMA